MGIIQVFVSKTRVRSQTALLNSCHQTAGNCWTLFTVTSIDSETGSSQFHLSSILYQLSVSLNIFYELQKLSDYRWKYNLSLTFMTSLVIFSVICVQEFLKKSG